MEQRDEMEKQGSTCLKEVSKMSGCQRKMYFLTYEKVQLSTENKMRKPAILSCSSVIASIVN